MDSFEDLLNFSFIDNNTCNDFSWLNQSTGMENNSSATGVVLPELECTANECGQGSAVMENNFSAADVVSQERECPTRECPRKRGRSESCCRTGTKACREKLRRDKLNDRFIELSSVLEPGRPAKADKLAILGDAIRVLNQLRTEAQDLKEANEKLQEEISNLKAEKNELREEKCLLKADKGRLEQQLKPIAPAAFMPAHPAAYHAGANKMAVYPSYGYMPMWQYLPQSAVDTSHDHELRPPAA